MARDTGDATAYATRDGVALAYHEEPAASASGDEGDPAPSDGDPETVVFVEGLGYGRWMWRFQRAALAGRRTIVPDNRGTGDSDVPEGPYSIDAMAADLEAVLADAGVDRAHLVGASMGGAIALTHALEYDRSRSLSLFCATPGGPEAVPTPESTLERVLDRPDDLDEREAIRWRMAPAVSDGFFEERPELADWIVDRRLATDAPERARAWQAEAMAEFDVHDRLDEVDVPALVVHGAADRVVPVENGERLAAELPAATFVPIEDGPHLFFVEEPDVPNRQLRRFVADPESEAEA